MVGTHPLTIVHVLAPAPFGGLESVVRLLATGHQAQGHRIVLVTNVERDDHPFVCSLLELGLDVRPFWAPAREIRAEREFLGRVLASLASEGHPADVVHTHGYRPDILDLRVARRYGAAAVTTMHGFTSGDWKTRLYERLQLRAVRRADAVVAVSNGVYGRARRHGVRQERLHLIRNAYAPAIDFTERDVARQTLALSQDHFHVAWIGRLSHEKGPDVMLEAIGMLGDTHISLSFIGDGPMREVLRARSATLGIADRVTFHGAIPDASQFLRGFDALALSSRTEGTPMVIFEAMAAGVPIVATAVGGVPDVLSPAEALLAPPADSAALATALRRLAAGDSAAAGRVACAAARLRDGFGVQPWLTRYEALYRSVMAS